MRHKVPAWIALSVIGIVVGHSSPFAQVTNPPSSNQIVAMIGDSRVSQQDLDREMGPELARLESQLYEARRRRLDELIAKTLLQREADRQNVPVETFIASLTNDTDQVSDREVDRFLETNSALRSSDAKLRENVRAIMTTQKREAQIKAYMARLREKYVVRDFLPHPPIRRFQIAVANVRSKGEEHAPVTIVEFADLYCPYCRRTESAVNEVLKKYGRQVRFVFKDLPLDGLHPNARRLSESARCAEEQGLFWQFRDNALHAVPDGQGRITEAEVAKRAGLNVIAFERCVTSGQFKTTVQSDVDEANRLGVSGTPTFFVNGRMLVGIQSLDTFSKVIDEELANQ